MRMNKSLVLAAPLLAAALTLTACGEDEADSSSTGVSSEHNEQDISFASEMILHHSQAVQMSQMAEEQAESPEVRELAGDIEAAQGPEIEQMTEWLEAWGEEPPATNGTETDGGMDHGGMDMGDSEDMPGMMSQDQMDELASASGSEFDQMFLTMMIAHHEGAIEMARTEQEEGENPDAVALAEDIEEAQTDEIQVMEELLASGS